MLRLVATPGSEWTQFGHRDRLAAFVEQLERSVDESRQARRRPAPSAKYWGSPALDKLWQEIQRVDRLQLVDDDHEEAS